MLSAAQAVCRVADIFTQLLQIACKGAFGLVGEVPLPKLVRTALQAGGEFAIVHSLHRTAQLSGSPRLRVGKFARCIAQLLRQVLQVVADMLPVVDHFVHVGSRWRRRLLAGCALGVHLREQIAHMIGLRLLAVCQLLGRLGHLAEAPVRVLLLQTTQQIGGLAEPIGGTARIRRAGMLGSGALHVVVRLAQAIERLLSGHLTAIGCLFPRLLRIAVLSARLSTAPRLSTRLSGLS